MKYYTIAILGATGAVGQAFIEGLAERNFPVKELRLLASSRSVGKTYLFKDQPIEVQLACEEAFEGCDIVLGAVENDLSEHFAPMIKKANALYIDNSSAFRLMQEVPLVVPEVNGEDVLNHQGIIANPNCSTIIAMVAVSAIHKLSPIQSMIASTYQAVSGAGVQGMVELEDQIQDYVNNKPLTNKAFAYQIAFNLIPQIGGFDEIGYTSEEMKMQNEGRRLLHNDSLLVNCTCVRVPVMRSHSISITLQTSKPLEIETVKQAIQNHQGCLLVDNPDQQQYPMPLISSNQDLVHVGRIRKDLTQPNGISLWCCGDQIRKGAAINALQIAEKCIELKVI